MDVCPILLAMVFPEQGLPEELFFAHLLHAIACAVAAAIGACFSALDKDVKVRRMLYYVSMAAFIGFCGFYGWQALWPSMYWYGCLPIVAVLGFVVYGIAAGIRKAEKTVGNVSIVGILKDRLGVQVDKDEEKPDACP